MVAASLKFTSCLHFAPCSICVKENREDDRYYEIDYSPYLVFEQRLVAVVASVHFISSCIALHLEGMFCVVFLCMSHSTSSSAVQCCLFMHTPHTLYAQYQMHTHMPHTHDVVIQVLLTMLLNT